MNRDIFLQLLSTDSEVAGREAPEPVHRSGLPVFEEAPGDGSEAALFSRTKNLDERWSAWVNEIDR